MYGSALKSYVVLELSHSSYVDAREPSLGARCEKGIFYSMLSNSSLYRNIPHITQCFHFCIKQFYLLATLIFRQFGTNSIIFIISISRNFVRSSLITFLSIQMFYVIGIL